MCMLFQHLWTLRIPRLWLTGWSDYPELLIGLNVYFDCFNLCLAHHCTLSKAKYRFHDVSILSPFPTRAIHRAALSLPRARSGAVSQQRSINQFLKGPFRKCFLNWGIKTEIHFVWLWDLGTSHGSFGTRICQLKIVDGGSFPEIQWELRPLSSHRAVALLLEITDEVHS